MTSISDPDRPDDDDVADDALWRARNDMSGHLESAARGILETNPPWARSLACRTS